MGLSTLVHAADVTVSIEGRNLVDGVGLDVEAGEVLALTGPNGAGKSTLLRVFAGELVPTSGRVELAGRPLADVPLRERARLRSVMPQETLLPFAFTVREVIGMGRHPYRDSPAADAEAIEQALRWTELEEFAQRTFPTLSGGERGRTTLARVLAQEARVLLLDEPTAALDIRHQERAMTIARAFADGGGAVVVVLHDLNLAAAYADRIALMEAGTIAAVGDPWEVLREDVLARVFQHPVTVTRSPSGHAPLVVPAR